MGQSCCKQSSVTPGKKKVNRFRSVAVYDSFQGFSEETPSSRVTTMGQGAAPHAKRDCWARLKGSIDLDTVLVLVVLILVGIVAATFSFAIDLAITQLYRAKLIVQQLLVFSYALQFIVWLLWTIVGVTASTLCVSLISQQAAGSGIPEMKSILSGLTYTSYLSFATLCAKVPGLIFAFAGGLHVGKEGPFVHISSCIANQIMRVPVLRRIKRDEALRIEVLAAACAVGVSTSFGAPIGGVLFGVEVTSTFYLVSNLWKAFFCAASGALVIRIIGTVGGSVGIVSIFKLTIPPQDYDYPELFAFAIVGLLGGLLSSLFVRTFGLMLDLLAPVRFLKTRWGLVFRVVFVSFCVGVVSMTFSQARNDLRETIQYLLRDEKLYTQWVTLVMILIASFTLTMLSLGVLSIPAGIYTPLFLMGATFGRLCGEAMALMFPSLDINPSVYAVVGAAAMCGGATKTISTAVIVIELTGQVSLTLPILISTLLAVGVGRLLHVSIYDLMLQQKGLPYLPDYKEGARRAGRLLSKDLMRLDLEFVALDSPVHSVKLLLEHSSHSSFPLVETGENMILLGRVLREDLENCIAQMGDAVDSLIAFLVTSQPVSDPAVVPVDSSALRFSQNAPLYKTYFCFTMLGLSHLYIVERGVLIGVITRQDLLRYMHSEEHIE